MKVVCDLCEAAPAVYFCGTEAKAYCDGCDTRTHSGRSKAAKHSRLALTPAGGANLCDICQMTEAVIFCKDDRALLCRGCDMATHSTNHVGSTHVRLAVASMCMGLDDAVAGCESAGTTAHVGADDGARAPKGKTAKHQAASMAPPQHKARGGVAPVVPYYGGSAAAGPYPPFGLLPPGMPAGGGGYPPQLLPPLTFGVDGGCGYESGAGYATRPGAGGTASGKASRGGRGAGCEFGAVPSGSGSGSEFDAPAPAWAVDELLAIPGLGNAGFSMKDVDAMAWEEVGDIDFLEMLMKDADGCVDGAVPTVPAAAAAEPRLPQAKGLWAMGDTAPTVPEAAAGGESEDSLGAQTVPTLAADNASSKRKRVNA